MITDPVRAEYEHRFAMYDTDGDGYLTAQDFTDRARLLTDAVGEPADSPRRGRWVRGCATPSSSSPRWRRSTPRGG